MRIHDEQIILIVAGIINLGIIGLLINVATSTGYRSRQIDALINLQLRSSELSNEEREAMLTTLEQYRKKQSDMLLYVGLTVAAVLFIAIALKFAF